MRPNLRVNPIKWINSHIPRSGDQFWKELWGLLKVVFWAALLAPIILIPIYYLLVVYTGAPQIHLPGG